jgi:hypothetical protein
MKAPMSEQIFASGPRARGLLHTGLKFMESRLLNKLIVLALSLSCTSPLAIRKGLMYNAFYFSPLGEVRCRL